MHNTKREIMSLSYNMMKNMSSLSQAFKSDEKNTMIKSVYKVMSLKKIIII